MLDKTAKILIIALIITNILTIIALTHNPFTVPNNVSNNPTTLTTSISTTSIPTIPLKQIRITNVQLITCSDNIFFTITVQNTGSIPAKSIKVLLSFLHNLTIPLASQTPQTLQPTQTYTLLITGKASLNLSTSYPITVIATFPDNTQETNTTYITPTTTQSNVAIISSEQQSIQVCSATKTPGSPLLIESVDASANTNVATIRIKNIGRTPIQITGITLNSTSVTNINPNPPFWISPDFETSITITINSNFQEGPTYIITINYNIANDPSGAVSYAFWSTLGSFSRTGSSSGISIVTAYAILQPDGKTLVLKAAVKNTGTTLLTGYVKISFPNGTVVYFDSTSGALTYIQPSISLPSGQILMFGASATIKAGTTPSSVTFTAYFTDPSGKAVQDVKAVNVEQG